MNRRRQILVLSQNLPGRTEKNTEISVGRTDFRNEDWSWDFRNIKNQIGNTIDDTNVARSPNIVAM